jgi:L-ribulokinase
VCQDAQDWIDAAKIAVHGALSASGVPKEAIVGVGSDFTSCTLLPCFADGSPMYFHKEWRNNPHAWPVLWKHHGAIEQADQLTLAATEAGCGWLDRYSGIVGCEWLFPKALELHDKDPAVFRECDVLIEAGDWFVWQLVGGSPESLTRSTCQAGYKACWSEQEGYPTASFLNSVRVSRLQKCRN